jgi:hypothetical protein
MTPFKVICTRSFPGFCQVTFQPISAPQILDEDVVIEVYEKFNATYYRLKKYPWEQCYRADHFATLPEASADEMQQEEHEAIIYQR